MARIIKTIEVEDQPAVALFDSGAVNTYVLSNFVGDSPKRVVRESVQVVLGGNIINIRELCIIEGKIEGLNFFTDAVSIDVLGTADGHELDILIGALTMERWEIKLDLKNGILDLEGLRRREFTEF